jgi:hypothetical protein
MVDVTRRELLMAIPGMAMAGSAVRAATACGCTERWTIKMVLNVPRVFNNTSSTGYRKYQRQSLRGEFTVTPLQNTEPDIQFTCLENATHKVNGQRVAYEVIPNGAMLWHGIGNNSTGKFATRSVVLPIEAMPSYAIGPAPNEDNSLVVVLAGKGTPSGNVVRGYVSGQLGCGCYEYGHVSPTRVWGTDRVVDTAAVFGTWTARRIA